MFLLWNYSFRAGNERIHSSSMAPRCYQRQRHIKYINYDIVMLTYMMSNCILYVPNFTKGGQSWRKHVAWFSASTSAA